MIKKERNILWWPEIVSQLIIAYRLLRGHCELLLLPYLLQQHNNMTSFRSKIYYISLSSAIFSLSTGTTVCLNWRQLSLVDASAFGSYSPPTIIFNGKCSLLHTGTDFQKICLFNHFEIFSCKFYYVKTYRISNILESFHIVYLV